jgi:glycosyltransferase involved in cell wall biosynthesis
MHGPENGSVCFVLLGVHRTGASVLAGILHHLGCAPPKNLAQPESDDEISSWESEPIVKFNDRLLARLGSYWHDWRQIGDGQYQAAIDSPLTDEASKLVDSEFGNHALFVLKDPRICRLLPFWINVFEKKGIRPVFVNIVRNPLEVSASLHDRDGLPLDYCELIWLRNALDAEYGSREHPRTFVSYDECLNDWRVVADRLAPLIEPAKLNIGSETALQINKFVSSKHRHHTFHGTDIKQYVALANWTHDAYGLLDQLTKARTSKTNLRKIDALRNQIDDASHIFGKIVADGSMASLKLARTERVYESLIESVEKDFNKEREKYLNRAEEFASVIKRFESVVDKYDAPSTEPEINYAAVEEAKQTIAEKDDVITHKDEQIGSLGRQLAELRTEILHYRQNATNLTTALAMAQNEVNSLKSSTRWRIATAVHSWLGRFNPAKNYTKTAARLVVAEGGIIKASKRMFGLLRRHGIRDTFRLVRNQVAASNTVPVKPTMPADDFNPVQSFGGPKFSIVVPIYNTPHAYLQECILSVRQQYYQNWELILVDDKSPDPGVRAIIAQHASEDPRIRAIYSSENGNISATINKGLEVATGEYFTVLDHDDTLDPSALHWVAVTTLADPEAVYIYTDEDKLTEDGRTCLGAFHKPGWSPEYMLSMMYTCHMSVFKTKAVREVGGYRSEFDGAQDYDLTLRIVATTDKIVRIPRVLYHWRMWSNSTAASIEAKPYSVQRQHKAIQEYLDSLGEKYSIEDGPLPGHHAVVFHPKRESFVSIVIPTANGKMTINGRQERHIDEVIKSILTKSTYGNYEIIVVHNGDLTRAQLSKMNSNPRISLVHYDKPVFSLAEKINMGCAAANGEYLIILNDDVRVITEDWIERMLGVAQRDGVGVVGAKLLFPDRTIQHAGVVMLGGLPGHAYYGQPEDTQGYALGALVDRGYIAVTGACQMTPRALFEEVGGYSLKFPLNYNDVDYCLRLHQKGYRSVSLANVKLFHYEGVSKDGGRAVASEEIQKFLDEWSHLYFSDPFYNPHLSQTSPYGM